MKKLLVCLSAVLLLLLAVPGQATVIFSNFGTGDSYNLYTSSVLSSAGSEIVGKDLDQGNAFTPVGTDYCLDTIELAVHLCGGTNELDVWLMTDAAGVPGTIIESFFFADAMGSGLFLNPLLVGNSALHPVLSAGTQYWLVASTPGEDTWAGWNYNSIGDIGPRARREDMGAWYLYYYYITRDAFRITGEPVPEPTTMLMLVSGLIGLFAFRRKFKR